MEKNEELLVAMAEEIKRLRRTEHETRVDFVSEKLNLFIPEIARPQGIVKQAVNEVAEEIVARWEDELEGIR